MGGSYPFGLFSWTDISTPDVEGARAFYTGLFGWESEDQFDPDGNYIYTMFRIDGNDVAGMGKQMPEHTAQGIPPFWNSYVTVANADDTVAAAEAAGASVLVEPMDVFTSGRMAFLADPAGASFAIWQAGDTRGAEVFGVHGAMSWNELTTPDVDAAKSFYGDVMGWSFEASPMGEDYTLIIMDNKVPGDGDMDDNFNGGMMPLSSLPEGVPTAWSVYFLVDDTESIVARVQELGGSVISPAFDTPAGRMAVVADAQGGAFNVIQNPPEQ